MFNAQMKCLNQAHGKMWSVFNGDCCELVQSIPDNSIHLCLHSPPFANLYIYTDSLRDMGNSYDDEEFFAHYEFLIKELHRVIMPGRLVGIHCKHLPLYMNRDEVAGVKDFPGEIIRAYQAQGFTLHSPPITIWKDPVTEMERTKNHGLLYRNFRERSECVRVGMPDYLIIMRKWDKASMERSESPEPVFHDANKRMTYYGLDAPRIEATDNPKGKYYDRNLAIWQKYASPVWFDIDQTDVLNYRMAKESDDEKHICPLQLDLIARSIQMFTNKGDIVYSPFAGIGSEGVQSVKLGRRFVGHELKDSYFDWMVKYLQEAEIESQSEDMFSQAGMEI